MARPFAREGAQYSRIASAPTPTARHGLVRRAPLVFLAPARADLSLRAVRPFVCTEQCGSERGEHETWVNKSSIAVRAKCQPQASHAARPLRATQRACAGARSQDFLAGPTPGLEREMTRRPTPPVARRRCAVARAARRASTHAHARTCRRKRTTLSTAAQPGPCSTAGASQRPHYRARRRAAHRLPLPITGAPPPAPRSTPAPKPTPAQAAPSPPRPAGPARVQPPSYPFEHRRSTLASWPASQLDSCP